ncbi:WD40 repeat protein [Knufia obscura]|uniref:WD40 repeat protein n=2 Tax=Knufia TaxID=430999 RepID=A0AAN8ICR2_9EURO|nr:WD40 repeat protein [Knufia obscura]KAK5958821.1 WD40 repeat protein [Knufia fluminis]
MYWPCGVPQIYAHHTTENALGADRNSLDDNGSVNDSHDRNGDGRLDHSEPTAVGDSTGQDLQARAIIDIKIARAEHIIAAISPDVLDIWSLRPAAPLASLKRSEKSLTSYGTNVGVHFRPDGTLVVLHTSLGFLILYAVDSDSNARVLQQRTQESQTRKQSIARTFGAAEVNGLPEIVLRFRKTIKIDAGISSVIATDQDLIVATVKPAAIQCIRWETQKGLHQTSTQLLGKMAWIENKSSISHMVHDRAMNLSVWLDSAGAAYAVRRLRPQLAQRASSEESSQSSASSAQPASKLFDGYRFHNPSEPGGRARFTAINAKFSLIAVATESGKILCFAAKDYAGNIPLSHTFKTNTSPTASLSLTSLTWSPDGYCLFAGFESGWATWSVFGKEGASAFTANTSHAESNAESWLLSISSAHWVSAGSEMLLTSPGDARIWKLDFSRSAAVGMFSCANLVRALQQTPTELAVYRGHELPDLTSISNEASLWHHAQYPVAYMHNQWPVRTTVISQDGRYIAIAGRRGLAHYSVTSGRWRVFSDFAAENSFAVRGGMCWFNHVVAVATEHSQGYDLRLYSRDQELGRKPLHAESFPMPIAFIGPSGEDSLLVYTYENVLYHFIVNITERGAQLLQVGQIAFHGVVRAPSRVRSVSWILPENQLRNGDPSRDVEHAAVLFLIDDKLVLLNPSRTPEDAIKYDMRVIAHQVEYYILMRDQIYFNFSEPLGESAPPTPSPGGIFGSIRNPVHYSLRDSLWIFTGENLCLWSDIRDLLQSMVGVATSKQTLLSIPVDFYPLSILLNKGIVLGIESELLQRRDVNFAQFRTLIRTQLFVPYVLRYQLLEAKDTAIAFAIAHQYQNLTYFPHALEILLHIVLDDEPDRRKNKTASDDHGALPAILSFLQMVLSPENYLTTIVQCVRKTEFSFWQYLFARLPLPETMFEQAIALNDLKTASGYLIVIQTFEEEQEEELDNGRDAANRRRFEEQIVRLMSLARSKNDFELCSELARFMIGIDPRGDTLRRVMQKVGFTGNSMYLQPQRARLSSKNIALQQAESVSPFPQNLGKLDVRLTRILAEEPKSAGAESEGVVSRSSAGDYFSASPGGYV